MVSKSHQTAFNLGANTGCGSKSSHQQNSLTWILKTIVHAVTALKEVMYFRLKHPWFR